MKHLKFLIICILFPALGLCVSCSSEPTPVDKYVELIDQATEKIEAIESPDQVGNIMDFLQNEEAMELDREYADYELTDNDKKKLKSSIKKLTEATLNVMLEFGGLSDQTKEQKQLQIKMITDMVDKKIDDASTLGQVSQGGWSAF